MSFVLEKIVDMEGIGLKELPSWFIFLSHAFGKITGSSPLPETLFIFKSILWFDQFIEKLYFCIIFFEASSK